MTFVPYTKDAIAQIKNGATPADLGWSELFYSRVCKDHGLAPNILRPKPHILSDVSAPPLAPPISCTQAKSAKKVKPPAVVATIEVVDPTTFVLNLATRTVRRGDVIAHLARQQTDVLRLINRGTTEAPMNGRLIAQRLGLDPKTGNVAGAIKRLREKLAPIGIKIIADIARHDSGYHIADAISGAPIKLRVAGVAKS